ncbi:MAG: molybdopterin molybdotransferase MoeA [Gammaproteobacteria bacterium]|nr:molybdopterin molybdotransferase MoeA [Gammaproteobacteria bacterium]
MITTAEATQRILAAVQPLGSETVSMENGIGRILQESVNAERDQPPFDRVMMDGIAIAHAEFATGQRTFEIQAMQAAGDEALQLDAGKAIEIMTGASLPIGADCIIPIERVTINEAGAHVEANYATEVNQFIHPRGSDHKKDTELLKPGTRVTPMDIAIIASCGLPEVTVAKQPAISVISTGNELVAAGEPIEAHQVRLSNGPAVIAMLESHGYTDSAHEHIIDEPALLRDKLTAHLSKSDVLILSGGVSMGKADYVPEVLSDLGVTVNFHKISQRPGKPMWFGMGPDAQAVFALPGNPVSTLVCCRQYVIPALHHMSGMNAAAPQFASLTQDISFNPPLTNFLPVRLLSNAAGQVLAMPVHTNTSGDFASLSGTDGYVELAHEQTEFTSGTTVPLHRWRQ